MGSSWDACDQVYHQVSLLSGALSIHYLQYYNSPSDHVLHPKLLDSLCSHVRFDNPGIFSTRGVWREDERGCDRAAVVNCDTAFISRRASGYVGSGTTNFTLLHAYNDKRFHLNRFHVRCTHISPSRAHAPTGLGATCYLPMVCKRVTREAERKQKRIVPPCKALPEKPEHEETFAGREALQRGERRACCNKPVCKRESCTTTRVCINGVDPVEEARRSKSECTKTS